MTKKRKLTNAFIKNIKAPKKRTEYYDTIVSGLILRVTKTGHKSFAQRYWYDEKSKQLTIGKYGEISLAEAREKARELKVLVNEGIDPLREKKERREEKPTTFLEAIESYKKHHLPTLKASTKEDYESRIKHLIKGEGKRKTTKSRGLDGSRYIKNIKRYEIIDLLNKIGRDAPTQANRLQAILSGIFQHAKNREWVSTNIAREISIKSKPRKKENKYKWQNTDLCESDIKTLWKAFDEHAEPVGSYLKMLLLLGQRSGETRLMKWDDIDLENKSWTIPASDTKNGTSNFVPLPNMTLQILEDAKPWTNGKFVFESQVKKGQPIGSQQKAAQRIRKKSGVKAFNLHSLRTTVATQLAGLGTPPQVLSKILNHKKPGEGSLITAIYNKYDYEKEKRNALNKWELKLRDILSNTDKRRATIHRLGS
ncbi:MAG TPA: hypothetical protein DD671_17015 [Balneolaceae bacterium]|nr:hypothetical protein [Balneolaceae bacterium]